MAAFDLDADIAHPTDFGLMRDGGLALFRQRSVLKDAERDLATLGCCLVRMDALCWNQTSIHDSFSTALGFPDYYGRNSNALADCLRDVAHGDYGWTATAAGLAVTLDGFGSFAQRESDLSTALAHKLAAATRQGMLFGHRLLWLLQADDGQFRTGPVGCFDVPWNPRDWLNSQRH